MLLLHILPAKTQKRCITFAWPLFPVVDFPVELFTTTRSRDLRRVLLLAVGWTIISRSWGDKGSKGLWRSAENLLLLRVPALWTSLIVLLVLLSLSWLKSRDLLFLRTQSEGLMEVDITVIQSTTKTNDDLHWWLMIPILNKFKTVSLWQYKILGTCGGYNNYNCMYKCELTGKCDNGSRRVGHRYFCFFGFLASCSVGVIVCVSVIARALDVIAVAWMCGRVRWQRGTGGGRDKKMS